MYKYVEQWGSGPLTALDQGLLQARAFAKFGYFLICQGANLAAGQIAKAQSPLSNAAQAQNSQPQIAAHTAYLAVKPLT